MDIQLSQEQGRVPVTVIHLKGELGGESYHQLEESAQQAISQGARYLLLDMSGITFMGSAGIRAIYKIFESLRKLPEGEDEATLKTSLKDGKFKSRRLKLLNASKQVQDSLAVTGFSDLVEFHNDLKKAVNSF